MELNSSPKDTLGRPLQEGDGVLLIMRGPVLFRIAEVTPVLPTAAMPNIPADLVTVHCYAFASYTCKRGAKHAELLRVGTVEELGPLPMSITTVHEPRS